MARRSALAKGLGPLVALLLGVVGRCVSIGARPRVSLYMTESSSVLDLSWSKGPENLRQSLLKAGVELSVAASGQPRLAGLDAYLIPPTHGSASYAEAENMDAVANYISSGGLVVLTLNGLHQADDADFVSRALGYTGEMYSIYST